MPQHTIHTTVWLHGDPVFSLSYKDDLSRESPSDVASFRPDPRKYLKVGVKYKADVTFDKEMDLKGRDILALRKVKIGDAIFVRIR